MRLLLFCSRHAAVSAIVKCSVEAIRRKLLLRVECHCKEIRIISCVLRIVSHFYVPAGLEFSAEIRQVTRLGMVA